MTTTTAATFATLQGSLEAFRFIMGTPQPRSSVRNPEAVVAVDELGLDVQTRCVSWPSAPPLGRPAAPQSGHPYKHGDRSTTAITEERTATSECERQATTAVGREAT